MKCGGKSRFLHKIPKSAAWKGGLRVLEECEEDVKHMTRCEEKRKEWAKRWQCDSALQSMEDKPWRTGELRSREELLPQNKENLERAVRSYKLRLVSPKGPVGLFERDESRSGDVFEKNEQFGKVASLLARRFFIF